MDAATETTQEAITVLSSLWDMMAPRWTQNVRLTSVDPRRMHSERSTLHCDCNYCGRLSRIEHSIRLRSVSLGILVRSPSSFLNMKITRTCFDQNIALLALSEPPGFFWLGSIEHSVLSKPTTTSGCASERPASPPSIRCGIYSCI